MIRFAVGVALAALVAACSPNSTSKAPSQTEVASSAAGMGAATIADFKTATPVKELMGHMMDFGAFGVWNRQGWLIDKDGSHELFPTTAAEWVNAESAAISLAETSNVLLMPGRPPDEDRRWVDNAHMLYDAAMTTQAAAQRAGEAMEKGDAAAFEKEKLAFFDGGGLIYDACTTCHAHYVNGDAPGPVAKLPELPNRVKPN
jgi:hypothetical protein